EAYHNRTEPAAAGSDTPGIGPPDQLVELDLHPGVEPRIQKPAGEIPVVHLAEDGGKEERGAEAIQTVAPDHVHGPVEVLLARHHELQLVARPERGEPRQILV